MTQSATVKRLTPEVSDWMLEHIDLSLIKEKDKKQDLAYLRGEREISIRQLEDLSNRVHIPIGYFLLAFPPEEDFSLLGCRTLGSVDKSPPSRELADVMTRMEDIQNWIREQLIDEDRDPVDFSGALDLTVAPEDAMKRIRDLLRLEEDWYTNYKSTKSAFDDLRERMGELGVTVILDKYAGAGHNRPLQLEEFRAFAMYDDYAPLIFINANDAEGAQLFSLMHEFVHICIGDSDLADNPEAGWKGARIRPEEHFCSVVAGGILVPASGFSEQWESRKTGASVTDISRELSFLYKCSRVVIARRALDLGLISRRDYSTVEAAAREYARREVQKRKEQAKEEKLRIPSSVIIQHNLSRRFVQMVATAVANRSITYTEAFRLTGTSNQTFFKLVKDAGGAPI